MILTIATICLFLPEQKILHKNPSQLTSGQLLCVCSKSVPEIMKSATTSYEHPLPNRSSSFTRYRSASVYLTHITVSISLRVCLCVRRTVSHHMRLEKLKLVEIQARFSAWHTSICIAYLSSASDLRKAYTLCAHGTCDQKRTNRILDARGEQHNVRHMPGLFYYSPALWDRRIIHTIQYTISRTCTFCG